MYYQKTFLNSSLIQKDWKKLLNKISCILNSQTLTANPTYDRIFQVSQFSFQILRPLEHHRHRLDNILLFYTDAAVKFRRAIQNI